MISENWRPIIHESERQLFFEVIESISSQLLKFENGKKAPGVLVGGAGISLYWAYANLTYHCEAYAQNCYSLAEESLTALENIPLPYSFCNGVSGVMWGLTHLTKMGIILPSLLERAPEEVDVFLSLTSCNDLESGKYDYLHAALGNCIYFIETNNDANINKTINKIVTLLEKNAVELDDGIAWKWVDPINGNTGYNLGLSHGIPSIIVLLSKFLQRYPVDNRINSLLSKNINWLLKQRQKNNISCFPVIVSEHTGGYSRLGWCYGDLGIAIALLQAGKSANNIDWENIAIEIALHSTHRTNLEENGIKDAGLCHGSAGVAHIFNRFYQYTGIEQFKIASNYWFFQILAQFKSPNGLKSYKKESENGPIEWRDEFGLLEGLAGIGLSLISALNPIEPKWDRCLLLS